MSYEFGINGIRKLKQSVLQFIILNSSFIILLSSCSVQKQIHQSAQTDVLSAKALQTAHVGISIFDPSANKYLYNYQGDKYFVPASNTKIPTCYAAMKYLGDSLVGMRYKSISVTSIDRKDSISLCIIEGTGDPTLLHQDFTKHRVLDFLKTLPEMNLNLTSINWGDEGLGSGWSWNDFEAYYMAERSAMPIYGNLVKFNLQGDNLSVIPDYFMKDEENNFYLLEELSDKNYTIKRNLGSNKFYLQSTKTAFKKAEIPFKTSSEITAALLSDTLKKTVQAAKIFDMRMGKESNIIKSQPTDSVLKPMMHRSDNFFAEQMLLMVSNEILGVMNDAKIIDTILKTDLKDLPQKPRWVDGSGLSRYNLFSPQDFVAILNKMKNEFGMERIKEIFPTGGEGTISSYYQSEKGFIYGKTGTLSGVVAFSGFLYTQKGKLLIFSTLVNNHNDSATDVRRAIEKFLKGIRSKY